MSQTVFITGCSSGIGFEAAKLFHQSGWNVIATMRKPESEAGQELAKLSNTVVTRLDLVDVDSIKPAVEAAIAKFGKIDVLVNNAGYAQNGLLEAISREQIQEQFDTNVFGLIDTIKVVLPHMRSNDIINGRRGTIVNVGSGAGKFTLPLLSVYAASKHALEGLTEAISYELSSQHIAVKMIIPQSGVAKTKFIDRGNSTWGADPSLTSYGDFLQSVLARYGSMTTELSLTSDVVAKVIYESVTDKSDKLRYYVGEDSIMSKKQTLSEEEFIQFVRSNFM